MVHWDVLVQHHDRLLCKQTAKKLLQRLNPHEASFLMPWNQIDAAALNNGITESDQGNNYVNGLDKKIMNGL